MSGIVNFGGGKPAHYENMKECEWRLGSKSVDELHELKKPRCCKNYTGSFFSNTQGNIDTARKKEGIIFSATFDHRKVNH